VSTLARVSGPLSISVLRPHELGEREFGTWRAFRAAQPAYASPYFDPRYTLAAGAVAPHARVAVLHRAGRPVGFFPFQKRGGLVQPLGAPMTDYHGVVAAPGERIDLPALLAGLGVRVFRFSGLKTEALSGAGRTAAHPAMVADLSSGFEPWLEGRQALHPRFFKGKRRAARAIVRDLGPLRLDWSRDGRGLLDHVVQLKRAQYRRTRRHDVFACGWTERLLRRLAEARDADFGLTFAALYAGDTLVGAELGLMSGSVHHLWLPVYAREHARYGPGMQMTIESLRAAAEAGLTRVDFGRADAGYKAYFAEPAGTVAEGAVRAAGVSAAAREALLAAAPSTLGPLGERLRRRIDVIAACETTAWGRCAAAAALATGVVLGAASPTTVFAQLRRPHEQRTGSQVVAATEGGVRERAADLRPSSG
jgi:CelD/BcsL family acetyltransferase involved in cellulose biosynthesis